MNDTRVFWVRSAEPVAMNRQDGWAYRVLKRDYPGLMGRFSAYVLSLDSGCVPHDIHGHVDEEILIPLTGCIQMRETAGLRQLQPGTMVFHTPGHQHTHGGSSADPSTFVVFKWSVPGLADFPRDNVARVVDISGTPSEWTERGGVRRRRIWERLPLAGGGALIADVAEVAANTAIPVHSHQHDLVLVVTEGTLSGFGHYSPAPSVIYYPAGTPHGVVPSPEPMRMLAFEFHAPIQ